MSQALSKSLSRLSRPALVNLCSEWAQSRYCTPYLTTNRNVHEAEEEDYLHEPVENTHKLRQLYQELQEDGKHTLSKREIIDRIVDGDWRRGLSLHQLATIDFAYMEENDAALRWSALKLVSTSSISEAGHPTTKKRKLHHQSKLPHYPRVDPAKFLQCLKHHISPLVKAHYSMHRLTSSNLVVLRLYIVPSAGFALSKSTIPTSPKHATDSARIMYIALPDSCPYVYVSLSGASFSKTLSDPTTSAKTKVDINTTKRIVLEAIPKAFSRPQERWSVESTKLTTRSLKSMTLLRGNSRPGTAGGAYSSFSEEYASVSADDKNGDVADLTRMKGPTQLPPLHVQCPTPPPEEQNERDLQVNRRFGKASGASHAPLNRVQVRIENLIACSPGEETNTNPDSAKRKSSRRKRKRLSLEEIERGDYRGQDLEPQQAQTTSVEESSLLIPITITFGGTDIIAGLKQLALLGSDCLDTNRMPGWITGEKNSSAFTV